MQKSVTFGMKFGGFDWDSGNLSKCLGHGLSLAAIEAPFAGDVYVVRDTIASGERRIMGFGNGAGRWIFCVFTLARDQNPAGTCTSCTRRRSSAMSKKFPDLRSDEEPTPGCKARTSANTTSRAVKKVRFELARKDASISLRLPAALLATLKANAARANMPTQRFIRMMIEAQLGQADAKSKRKPQRKTCTPVPTGNRAA